MDDHLPWLCQGDVFEVVPQGIADISATRDVTFNIDIGPAVLLTHGCDLDKRGPNGQPRIERLHFLPLRDLARQDSNRRALARKRELAPYEVLYVGEVPTIGEAFALLSEAYYLPGGFFELRLEEFPDHPEADPESRHLVAGRHANRFGRLDADTLRLLHQKLAAHWTRYELSIDGPSDP